MISVEIFSSPGCGKCTQAKNLLKALATALGESQIAWREVNILDEIDYAVSLGVMSTPAVAISGELIFSGLPSAEKLRAELQSRLARSCAT